MPEIAVITPSYRADAEKFRELHRSVLEFTAEDTLHHVFVPPRDRALFREYEGPRCRVWTTSELLPRRFAAVPGNLTVNFRRPWPPIRGWIMQQAVKIAAAGQSDADVVLTADSDVVLVRPVRAARFKSGAGLSLYREEGGVTDDMDRHVIWHRVAREMLGLPAGPKPPLPDYVSPLNHWDPAVVRAMQERIAEVTGRNWLDSFCSQLHISEFILYGVFVDEVLGASGSRPPADITICHNSWERWPLDLEAAIAFAEQMSPAAVAMMISAKSGTPEDVRRAAIRRSKELAGSRASHGR
jgi:Family of unknown function (DUF6492)